MLVYLNVSLLNPVPLAPLLLVQQKSPWLNH